MFIPEIKQRRLNLQLPEDAPAILFMGGHKSHNTEKLRATLAAHHIALWLFVPHASHIMQPLDLVLFFLYKSLLRKQIDLMLKDGYVVVTETDRRNLYLQAAAEVIPMAFRSYPIKSAFRRAGLYPASADPVLNNPCVTNQPITPIIAPRTSVDISRATESEYSHPSEYSLD